MDIAAITTLLSTFGFPVVMTLIMAYYVKYSTDESNKRIDDLNNQHKEEMQQITDALNNNTIALTKLTDKLGD